METEQSARERIQQAFIEKMRSAPLSRNDMAIFLRIAETLDAHFTRYCSFYNRKKLMAQAEEIPPYYNTFLARLTDYERISVSELAKTAGVNRTTFYKYFPNVSALYDACCEDLTRQFLDVPVPAEKTPDAMRAYGDALWRLMEENNALLFTLSHRAQKRQLPYLIAHRLKEQLAADRTDEERVSFRVTENLAVFPELFSVRYSVMQFDRLLPDIYPDRNVPAYHPERSLIENIADLFAARYGGSFDFYYSLGGAALKLLAEKRFPAISVSELCKTAGYPRSTFYAYFSDHTDYVMKVCENAVLACYAAFLFFLENQEALTPGALAVFRGELVDYKIEGIRTIFRNGSITFIFAALFGYLTRTFLANETRWRGTPPGESFRSLLSYYIAYALRMFSMNYLGDMTDAELFAKAKELARIKEELRNA